jgi:DNA-binding transcriptional LysR family regulator
MSVKCQHPTSTLLVNHLVGGGLQSHYTLGGMVEAGLGITALPSMSLSILGHPRLMSARIVEPQVTRVIGVLRRRNDTLSPAATAFLAAVWEVFRKVSPRRKQATASPPPRAG